MKKYLEQAQAELELQHQLTCQQLQKLEKAIQENGAGWSEQSLWRQSEEKLRRINRARELVHRGSYGLCQTCGQAIAPERLLAVPEATECIQCSRKVAQKRQQTTNHPYQPSIA